MASTSGLGDRHGGSPVFAHEFFDRAIFAHVAVSHLENADGRHRETDADDAAGERALSQMEHKPRWDAGAGFTNQPR